jgi:catechol 2,3-dioxygenase-like lactoylglutathione lyase family enzyme
MVDTQQRATLTLAVPFFLVADMPRSLAFYVDGLGFEIYETWDHDGAIRWCWLHRDGVAVTLQDVGNSMWVTSLRDPDGCRIDFESKTDAPEESELEE